MENKLYDLTNLEKVCGGDNDFMNNMVNLFVSTTPEVIEGITTAINNNNFDTVSKLAHKIKPSVNYICITNLYQDVLEIEVWEKADDIMINKTNLLINNLTLVLEQLKQL